MLKHQNEMKVCKILLRIETNDPQSSVAAALIINVSNIYGIFSKIYWSLCFCELLWRVWFLFSFLELAAEGSQQEFSQSAARLDTIDFLSLSSFESLRRRMGMEPSTDCSGAWYCWQEPAGMWQFSMLGRMSLLLSLTSHQFRLSSRPVSVSSPN